MTATEIVDELIYRSYRYNRLRTPDIKPEQWKAVFSNVDAMEDRLQKELKEKFNVQNAPKG